MRILEFVVEWNFYLHIRRFVFRLDTKQDITTAQYRFRLLFLGLCVIWKLSSTSQDQDQSFHGVIDKRTITPCIQVSSTNPSKTKKSHYLKT